MCVHHLLFFKLAGSLSFFLLHLHFDDALKLVTLKLSLFSKPSFLLCLLLLSGFVQFLINGFQTLLLHSFLGTSGALSSFHGALCPQRIHFRSFVCGFLLTCSQLCCFQLLLCGQPLLFCFSLTLHHFSVLLIFNNLLFLKLFCKHLFFFDLHGGSVCCIHLNHQTSSGQFLLLLLLNLFSFERINLLEDECSFLVA